MSATDTRTSKVKERSYILNIFVTSSWVVTDEMEYRIRLTSAKTDNKSLSSMEHQLREACLEISLSHWANYINDTKSTGNFCDKTNCVGFSRTSHGTKLSYGKKRKWSLLSMFSKHKKMVEKLPIYDIRGHIGSAQPVIPTTNDIEFIFFLSILYFLHDTNFVSTFYL